MKDLILFRGLPGAGKPTLAETLCDVAYSADDFFIQPDGAYVYDKARIKEAHEHCLLRTLRAMSKGVSRIGVANTFTEAWDDVSRTAGHGVSSVAEELSRHGWKLEVVAEGKNLVETGASRSCG